jgi:hypothetical protein
MAGAMLPPSACEKGKSNMGKRRGPEQKDLLRWYMDETGETEVDMHKVARWAILKGWKAPEPVDPVDRLARQLSKEAREQTRHDSSTGKPYRAYHAFTVPQGDKQLTLWIDIDGTAPRRKMHLSLHQRREQMVGDGLQLSFDADHWNGTHSTEEPINIDLDLTEDVEWRKNAPEEDEKKTG